MQKHERDGLRWLTFDSLSGIPGIGHAVFLRQGGSSKGPFESLNTGFGVGDQESDVQANLETIRSHFKRFSPGSELYSCKQVHGKDIASVTKHSPTIHPDCDGLVTNEKNKILVIKHADCQAALFYDPEHRAIANVHAGWRGSVLNIYEETIRKMNKAFGTDPTKLFVCISPSLGPESAEFINYSKELPEEFWPFKKENNRFDFWAVSSYQLQKAGVLPSRIEIAGIDTFANPEEYFSYRRNNRTGRHATCILLHE